MLKIENDFLTANGKDIAIFSCYCVDENGLEVPDASPFVYFNTNKLGCIVGTGSDVSDHNPVSLPYRLMRAGRITVAVEIGNESDELKLYATAENLVSGAITVELKK